MHTIFLLNKLILTTVNLTQSAKCILDLAWVNCADCIKYTIVNYIFLISSNLSAFCFPRLNSWQCR